MIWFAARSILGAMFALLLAAGILFFSLKLAPGAGDQSISGLEGYWIWLAGALTGDFGFSPSLAAPVGAAIGERLAVSGPLVLLGGVVAAIVGIGLGSVAARRRGIIDLIATGFANIGLALPNFWLGMLLTLLFSVTLRWLPMGGFVAWTGNAGLALASLLLPSLALGIPVGSALAIDVREVFAQVRASAYVRAARSRGLSEDEAIRRHGRRNAWLALLGRVGPILVMLIVGSVVVEPAFYLPGIGRLLVDAALAHDTVLSRAVVAVLMLAITVVLLAVRLGTGWADPRVSAPEPS